MSEFLRYFSNGIKNAVVVGTPNFEINNQYLDMTNISNDIHTSIKEIIPNEKRKPKQELRKQKTKLKRK